MAQSRTPQTSAAYRKIKLHSTKRQKALASENRQVLRTQRFGHWHLQAARCYVYSTFSGRKPPNATVTVAKMTCSCNPPKATYTVVPEIALAGRQYKPPDTAYTVLSAPPSRQMLRTEWSQHLQLQPPRWLFLAFGAFRGLPRAYFLHFRPILK